MIVSMKKLSLLLFHKEYKDTLKGLRELGVVHIHEDKKRSGKDDSLQAKLRIIKKIGELEIKFSYLPEKGDKEKVSSSDEKLLETLEGYFKKKEKLNQDLAYYKKNVSIYEPWGELDKTRISGLLKAGWTLRFFTVPDRKYKKEWETKYNAIIVNEDRGIKFFTTLTHNDDKMDIDADSFVFPKESLSETLIKVDTLTKEIAEQQEFIVQVAIDALKRLDIYRTSLLASTDELKIDDAAVSLVEDKVMALEGWIPVDTEQEVIEYCKSKKLYYDISKPTAKDEVPVKLKNNSFARLFEPITEMYSLPNYKELDPTPYFAPFYMLFFGLCMGDGGYGLLIIATCFLLDRKVPKDKKSLVKLGKLLGIATVFAGILTGSFFGVIFEDLNWAWLAPVKDLFLTTKNYGKYLGGYNPMMVLAVAIGIVQILFGMFINIMKITKEEGFKYARANAAWLVMLISLIITFGLPALGTILPVVFVYFMYAIMSICAIVIVFMNTPGKNIFINFGSALWGTYNMATGLLGDSLSYIRLFALGLTGSILGSVFNNLAFSLTSDLPLVAQIICILLILLFGHAINIGLCIVGAFVHPLRLTFVEFYKNAGFEGGGAKYSPFRKR